MDLTSILTVLGIPGIAIVCWATVYAVTHVATEWRKARVAECHAALKQEMVQRGMSADEIVRVFSANGASQDKEAVRERHTA